MSLLLPIMTLILVGVGAFLLFTAIEQDRKSRARFTHSRAVHPAYLPGCRQLQADHAGSTD
ncbi:hypothetical protein [Paenibacillus sp. GCM10027626]|uniref:hypothetical protein n=1 Tax=Paenibacillus sp. GCM10027626 TaxID=3273411 RepID=UPI003630F59C